MNYFSVIPSDIASLVSPYLPPTEDKTIPTQSYHARTTLKYVTLSTFEWLNLISVESLCRYINYWMTKDPKKFTYTFFRKVSQLPGYKPWFRKIIQSWIQKVISIKYIEIWDNYYGKIKQKDTSELSSILSSDSGITCRQADELITLYRRHEGSTKWWNYGISEDSESDFFVIIFLNELCCKSNEQTITNPDEDFALFGYEYKCGICRNGWETIKFEKVIFFAQHGIHLLNAFEGHRGNGGSFQHLSALNQYGYSAKYYPSLLKAYNRQLLHFDSQNPKEKISFLLDQGCDLNSNDNQSLCEAIRTNQNISVIEFLFQKGANPNIKGHKSPLKTAIECNNYPVVNLLVHYGVEINPSEDIETPLNLAISKGNLDIVKYLIEKGADVKKITSHGLKTENPQVFEYLFHHYLKDNQYISGSENQMIQMNINDYLRFTFEKGTTNHMIYKLLEMGADVNTAGTNGTHLLFYYANGSFSGEYLKKLVEVAKNQRTFLNFNHVNSNNETAFHLAVSSYERISSLLYYTSVENPINLDIQNRRGETALIRSIYDDQYMSAMLLLSSGANPNIKDKLGKSPLDVVLNRRTKNSYHPQMGKKNGQATGILIDGLVRMLVLKGAELGNNKTFVEQFMF